MSRELDALFGSPTVEEQSDTLFFQSLASAEQVFSTNTTVQSPSRAAGSILQVLASPGIHEKSSPSGLSEEIKELGNAGAFIFVKEATGDLLHNMTNQFYLQALEINSKERAQISNTFGASSVFLFGESAKIYTFSGKALDYASQNVQGEFFHGSSILDLYNKHLRGTKLVDEGKIAILKVLNHTIWGYPLNFSYRKMAGTEKTIDFAMSWVITDHTLTASTVVTNTDLEFNTSIEKYILKLGKEAAELIKSATEILNLIYGVMTNVEKVMSKRLILVPGDLEALKAEVLANFVEPLKAKLEDYKDTPTELKLIKNSHVPNFETYFSKLNKNINNIKAGIDAIKWYEHDEWSSLVHFYKFVFTQKQKLMSGSKI
jgi:hypothetical protein